MPKFSLNDLYVAVAPHTDSHSFDTSTPDEVFTSRDEAQAFVNGINAEFERTGGLTKDVRYFVEPLSDRITAIKDARYDQGRHEEATSGP